MVLPPAGIKRYKPSVLKYPKTLFFTIGPPIGAPLIGVHERTRKPAGIVEPAVRIERATVPIVGVLAVPLVGAALGDECHVCAGQRSVFPGIAVGGHGYFLHFVVSECEVRRAGVVKAENGSLSSMPFSVKRLAVAEIPKLEKLPRPPPAVLETEPAANCA